ncbi:MAG: ComF family protein [Bacteroidota bacterium]|nr:ComF family protein [Bacteroidota bacterium]
MIQGTISSALNALFDFILPRICPSCKNKLLKDEEIICSNCLNTIKAVTAEKLFEEFSKRFQSEGLISGIASLYLFEKDSSVQHLIHSIKYENRFQNAYFLGKLLGRRLLNEMPSWTPEIIIPIPLHPAKKSERGYNQSFYISKGISKTLGIPVSEKIVKRVKNTQTQTHLTLVERKLNVKGAFMVRSKVKIEGKSIILVDDVITSGSTITECARALKSSGADKIYAASAALA